MILHLRLDGGVLVCTAEILEWAAQVIDEYFDIASLLREGVHDVTPLLLAGGRQSRHLVRVLSNGTALYRMYVGEELQESPLATFERDEKTELISPSSPILVISLATRTPEVRCAFGIIFYYPNWEDFKVDLSAISKN